MDNSNKRKVLVIGGGAAGMMAALSAVRMGADVTILERNADCGKKLRITGKGRCNVTNDCTLEEFLQNVPSNPRFLYSALSRFDTADTRSFFESEGVPLKVERGRRVFPVSDRAEDIVRALVGACRREGVKIQRGRVSSLIIEEGVLRGVAYDGGELLCDAAIVATGGKSYPGTGSEGDGYALARSAGHSITPILPSLVPIASSSKICPALQGLSLKNVSLKITSRDGKRVYEDFGEMLFTHFGLSGPMILSASAHIPDVASGCYEAHINLKPALDEKTLDARILSDFAKYANKDFANALSDLLPQKLIPVIISLCKIDRRKKVNSITKEERGALAACISDLRIPLSGFRPIAEAIITKGGVSTREINPKTMASRLCGGLYFAGEVIDVDAYTGGYNLQIAFSTGVLSGEAAALGI